MHANNMEDISEANAGNNSKKYEILGEIFAIFGLECSTGDTLCEGDMSYLVSC